MKKRLSREVKIGIYGVSMIALLYLGVNFIKSQDIFSRNMTYYATYDNAEGIEASSPVVIKGFRVGTVEHVNYDIRKGNVQVEMSIKRDYPLPSNSEAKIVSASLLGGKVIEIKVGNSPTNIADGDTIHALIEPGLMEMATGEYDKLKGKATTLIEELSKALVSINAVLSEQNVANLSGTLANLNSMSGNIDHLVKTDVTQVLANLNNLSVSLKQAGPKINNIADNFSTLSDTLSRSVPELMAGGNIALAQLNTTLTAINSGNGTANMLLNDQKLYNNLTEASESLTLLLQDFKQNPYRYIQFSVFGGGTKNKDKGADQKSK